MLKFFSPQHYWHYVIVLKFLFFIFFRSSWFIKIMTLRRKTMKNMVIRKTLVFLFY